MGLLQDKLSGYYGSEVFYRLPMTNIVMTQGVQAFAEFGKAYWAVTDMTIAKQFKLRNEEFLAITVTSNGKKADIVYTDGNCNVLYKKHYAHTDLEEGEYKFYLTDNTLLLTSEY